MSLLEFASGLALGLALAGALYVLLWWQTRRGRLAPPKFAATAVPMSGADTVPAPSPVDAPEGPAEIDARVEASPSENPKDPPPTPALPTSPVSAPAREVPRRPTTPPSTLRLSQRVILHVYGQGTHVPGEVAVPGLCQAGMVAALGVPQAGLAAVLRRLEAAGILAGEKGHVRGHDRRLKVYRLTPKGLGLARELRSRAVHRPGK